MTNEPAPAPDDNRPSDRDNLTTSADGRQESNAQNPFTFDIPTYFSLPEDRRLLALFALTHLVYHTDQQTRALGATRRALIFAEKHRETGRDRADAVL